MFQPRTDKAEPRTVPKSKPATVKELAAELGITDRALRTCFARGCPRGPVAAIYKWRLANVWGRNGRAIEAPGLEAEPAGADKVTIDPTEVCLRFGRAVLDDSQSALFRKIDATKHRALLAEQLSYLCDLIDDPADLAERVIDRRRLFEELGLADYVAETYLDAAAVDTGERTKREKT
jgi:hypothetical protein